MKPLRLKGLPESLRREIKAARRARGWSQRALGEKAGLAQRHISDIEAGKTEPRYGTLIEILRALDLELVLTPRSFAPAAKALAAEHMGRESAADRPLYALTDEDDEDGF